VDFSDNDFPDNADSFPCKKIKKEKAAKGGRGKARGAKQRI